RAVPAGGEDRAHRRLADVAADMAAAVPGQQLLEALDAFHADEVIELLAGVGEVFAQALVDFHAAGAQLVLDHLLEQRGAAAAAGGGLGAGLDPGDVAAAAVDGRADRPLADVVAGADGGAVRQGVGTEGRGAFAGWHDQAGGI